MNQIKKIFKKVGIENEDEIEENEKELCILILNAGMVYHDKKVFMMNYYYQSNCSSI